MSSKCYLINVREPIRGQERAPQEELLNPMSSVIRGDRWLAETLTGSYGLWLYSKLEMSAPLDPPNFLKWICSCLRLSKSIQTLFLFVCFAYSLKNIQWKLCDWHRVNFPLKGFFIFHTNHSSPSSPPPAPTHPPNPLSTPQTTSSISSWDRTKAPCIKAKQGLSL